MSNIFTTIFKKLFKKTSCCKQCNECLHPVIDGEATQEEIEYLNEHIAKCKPCYDHYNIDKLVKEVVKQRLEKKEAPQDLINQIKDKIKC
jgi:anti-sigma factor (TIGR02949 family)